MELQPDLLSVILRLHTTDGSALPFLSQALFSLLHSGHRPLEAIVVTQRFNQDQIQQVEDLLAQFSWDKTCQMRAVHFSHTENKDHRSALLNAGIAAAKGRYLAFLDYDDYIYEHAYSTLIQTLSVSDAAAAFGGCLVAHAIPSPHGYKTIGKTQLWIEKTESDFLQGNIFPIHTFVIDRQRLKGALPSFNENSAHLEDYEFLLQLRLLTRFDLSCWKQMLVEYMVREDGTNTLFLVEEHATPAKKKAWSAAYGALKPLRERVTAHVLAEKSQAVSS